VLVSRYIYETVKAEAWIYPSLLPEKKIVAIVLVAKVNVLAFTLAPSAPLYRAVNADAFIVKLPELLFIRVTTSPSDIVEAGITQPVVLVETALPASAAVNV